MWYQKNLPTWERYLRLLSAVFMASCSWHFGMTPVGWIFGIAAFVTVITGLIGYCPMCQLSNRKPLASLADPKS